MTPLAPPAAQQPTPTAVIIWGMDETLILFNSLRSGAYAAAHGKNPDVGRNLAGHLAEIIFAMLDAHM